MYVNLGMHCACAILSSVTCSTLSFFFPHYFLNGTTFGKRLLNVRRVFLCYLQYLTEKLLVQEEFSEILTQMYIGFLVPCPLFL